MRVFSQMETKKREEVKVKKEKQRQVKTATMSQNYTLLSPSLASPPNPLNQPPPTSTSSLELLNIPIYFAAARATAPFSRSYTLYHLLRKASPRMANGPTGSGISIPMKVDTQLPPISRM